MLICLSWLADYDYESEEVDQLAEDEESDNEAIVPFSEDSVDSLEALEGKLFELSPEEMDELREDPDADVTPDHPVDKSNDIIDLESDESDANTIEGLPVKKEKVQPSTAKSKQPAVSKSTHLPAATSRRKSFSKSGTKAPLPPRAKSKTGKDSRQPPQGKAKGKARKNSRHDDSDSEHSAGDSEDEDSSESDSGYVSEELTRT